MTGVLGALRAAPRDLAGTVTPDFDDGGPAPVARQRVRTKDHRTIAYADKDGGGAEMF